VYFPRNEALSSAGGSNRRLRIDVATAGPAAGRSRPCRRRREDPPAGGRSGPSVPAEGAV